jgi:type I restriction enzyme R subunit
MKESVVEEATLEWLEGLGYTTFNASEIAPDSSNSERQTYADIVLIDRLRSALATINDKIPPDAIEDAIKKVTALIPPASLKTTAASTNSSPMAVDVEYQAEGRTIYDKVWLIDFTNPTTTTG